MDREPLVPVRKQTDGRMARRDRTLAKVVEAHADLLREGELLPTAAVVAERAGVAVRTLWSVFGDMEGLFQATTDYWMRADDALRREIDPDAPLAQRIDEFCAERVRRLESIGPAARAASLLEHESEALRASRRGHVQRLFHDAERVFATEIGADAAPEVLRDAICAAVSWNAWSFLREDIGRTVDEAAAAMHRNVRTVLRLDA